MSEEQVHETHGHKTTSSSVHGQEMKEWEEEEEKRKAERKGISRGCYLNQIYLVYLLVMSKTIMVFSVSHKFEGHSSTHSSEHGEKRAEVKEAERKGISLVCSVLVVVANTS